MVSLAARGQSQEDHAMQEAARPAILEKANRNKFTHNRIKNINQKH